MEVDQAYSIARRLSNNFYHRHNMVPHLDQAVLVDHDSCVEVENNLDLFFIKRAMKKLPDRIYQILDMSYFQHMTLKKIGIEMGLSEARISQLRSEGIEKLKGMFNDNGGGTTISH